MPPGRISRVRSAVAAPGWPRRGRTRAPDPTSGSPQDRSSVSQRIHRACTAHSHSTPSQSQPTAAAHSHSTQHTVTAHRHSTVHTTAHRHSGTAHSTHRQSAPAPRTYLLPRLDHRHSTYHTTAHRHSTLTAHSAQHTAHRHSTPPPRAYLLPRVDNPGQVVNVGVVSVAAATATIMV